jgi:hypothetical protein
MKRRPQARPGREATKAMIPELGHFALILASLQHSRLPTLYRIAGVWGGHEGSLLLWVLMLPAVGVAVSLFSRQPARRHGGARVLGVLGLVSVGFLPSSCSPPTPSTACCRPPPTAAT